MAERRTFAGRDALDDPVPAGIPFVAVLRPGQARGRAIRSLVPPDDRQSEVAGFRPGRNAHQGIRDEALRDEPALRGGPDAVETVAGGAGPPLPILTYSNRIGTPGGGVNTIPAQVVDEFVSLFAQYVPGTFDGCRPRRRR